VRGQRARPYDSNFFDLSARTHRLSGIEDAIPSTGGKTMEFDAPQNQTYYAVEVSGWDASETFFVEQTSLTWVADGMKEIRLLRSVREGCLLFVRLVQLVATSDSCPIACQALKVMEKGSDGRSIVHIKPLRPRALFKDAARELNFSTIRVA
jgi:hypothetical protein